MKRPAFLQTATGLVFALLVGPVQVQAASHCPAPGEPIQWLADYCMLKMQTDDEIAASDCMDQEGRRPFADACASNTHFKHRMCVLVIQNGTRTGTVDACLNDPGFMGRTVERGGVGR